MYNKKSVSIIFVFGVLTTLVLFAALNVSRSAYKKNNKLDVESIEETKFNQLKYYVLDASEPSLYLNAENLNIMGKNDLFFTKPTGYLINADKEKINYKGDVGTFTERTTELKLDGNVVVKLKKSQHTSDDFYYNGKKKYFEATGNVSSNIYDEKTKDTISVKANFLNSWIAEERSLFLGDVRGKLKRRRQYEGGFNFTSERMEANLLKSRIDLTGDVHLKRNNYHLESGRAEIFLENYNKKLKYYVLYDDIKLEEKLQQFDGTQALRRAYSEKLEGYMSESKVVLSGAPRVEQGDDLIKGYQITLRENVELVEVDDSQSSFSLNKDK